MKTKSKKIKSKTELKLKDIPPEVLQLATLMAMGEVMNKGKKGKKQMKMDCDEEIKSYKYDVGYIG